MTDSAELPGHWIDLANEGFFDEKPVGPLARRMSQCSAVLSSLLGSGSVGSVAAEDKPWGSVPVVRREWFYLKGDQNLPLGQNRWERFEPELQDRITHAAELRPDCPGKLIDLDDPEKQLVWYCCKRKTIAGLDPSLWHPTGWELPNSEMLKDGSGYCREGYFLCFAEEQPLLDEYLSARKWDREELPHRRVVLLVEQKRDSAVEEHGRMLAASTEYVVRLFNVAGVPVLGLKKNELQDKLVRDLKWRLEDIVGPKDETLFVAFERELHYDETLKSLCPKGYTTPVEVQVVYLTKQQAELKRSGFGAIQGGHWVDLARDGFFNNEVSTKPAPGCCVLS